jgi:hypothetical protein
MIILNLEQSLMAGILAQHSTVRDGQCERCPTARCYILEFMSRSTRSAHPASGRT